MLTDIGVEFKDIISGGLSFGVRRRGRSCIIALPLLEFTHRCLCCGGAVDLEI